MPVKDDCTCVLILYEIIHTCGLCDTEKAAIRYAIDQMEGDETDGDG